MHSHIRTDWHARPDDAEDDTESVKPEAEVEDHSLDAEQEMPTSDFVPAVPSADTETEEVAVDHPTLSSPSGRDTTPSAFVPAGADSILLCQVPSAETESSTLLQCESAASTSPISAPHQSDSSPQNDTAHPPQAGATALSENDSISRALSLGSATSQPTAEPSPQTGAISSAQVGAASAVQNGAALSVHHCPDSSAHSDSNASSQGAVGAAVPGETDKSISTPEQAGADSPAQPQPPCVRTATAPLAESGYSTSVRPEAASGVAADTSSNGSHAKLKQGPVNDTDKPQSQEGQAVPTTTPAPLSPGVYHCEKWGFLPLSRAEELLNALNPRGVRESVLYAGLKYVSRFFVMFDIK